MNVESLKRKARKTASGLGHIIGSFKLRTLSDGVEGHYTAHCDRCEAALFINHNPKTRLPGDDREITGAASERRCK